MKTRETFGDWEGDLMIFKRSQGTMNVAAVISVSQSARWAFEKAEDF